MVSAAIVAFVCCTASRRLSTPSPAFTTSAAVVTVKVAIGVVLPVQQSRLMLQVQTWPAYSPNGFRLAQATRTAAYLHCAERNSRLDAASRLGRGSSQSS